MIKTPVHKLLDKYKVTNTNTIDNIDNTENTEKKHNVLSQGGIKCRAGKWAVPDSIYPQLFVEIDKALSVEQTNELYFLEVPNDKFNMIKIDIDLRFKATDEELKNTTQLQRRYDDNLIKLIVEVLAENINQIIKLDDTYNIYVHEKKQPRININEKQVKDGIHIIIPELVMDNTALYYLREQIIQNDDLIEMLKNIGNITKISDVIDKRIIYPNAWYVYGCGKPDDKGDIYTVTKTYQILEDNIQKQIKLNKSRLELIKLFSNFGKVPNVEYNDTLNLDNNDEKYMNDKDATFQSKENKDAIYKLYIQDQSNFRNASTLTQEEIRPYLECLKFDRVNDYDDWKRVGISLFNMDHRNYELWRNWSKLSPKFNDDVCFKAWYKEFPKAGKYNLGLNKIRELAKQDNPEKFNDIININKLTKSVYFKQLN